MTGILDPKAPTPEEELADEIKAYEQEQTNAAAPEPEPEPEDDGDGEEVEAASDDEDQEPDQDAEAEGDGEVEEESPDEGHKGQRQVPLKALQAEREERARLQREFDELRGQMAAFAQMFQQQQPQQQQPEQAPPPDPEEDPIGYINYAKQQLQDINQWRQQQEQAEQQRAAQSQFVNVVRRHVSQFASEQDDYFDAAKYLTDMRAAHIKAARPTWTDEQVQQQIAMEEQSLALEAFQENENPAARVYRIAQSYGYQRKAAQPNPAAQPKPVAIDPNIEERKKAAALNTNRSNPPKAPLREEDLANLEGAAFDKAWAKMFGPENKRFV